MGSTASVARNNVKSSIIGAALECFNQNRKDFEQVEHDVQDEVGFLKLISDYPSILFDLLILISQKRLQLRWISEWSTLLQKSRTINILDYGKLDQLQLEGVDLDAIDTFCKDRTPSHLSAVIAECQGMNDLNWLRRFIDEEALGMVVLNVSANQISENAFINCAIQQSSTLAQLHIGGNNFSCITELVPHLPSCLLILDLSFTDGLTFSPGAFLSCPQLLQLSLDGCGIRSTTFDQPAGSEVVADDNDDCTDGSKLERMCKESIFFGLVSLVNLSIKENNLESLHSFQGLSFFSYQKATMGEQSENIVNIDCRLQNVCIADNPLCEIATEHRNLCTWIRASLPSVLTIDDKPLLQSPIHPVDHTSPEYRAVHNQQATLSCANISDSQEREFSAALRGERDVAVVS